MKLDTNSLNQLLSAIREYYYLIDVMLLLMTIIIASVVQLFIYQRNSFRVVSYNILADTYASSETGKHELFSYCPPYALCLDYRKQLITKELIGNANPLSYAYLLIVNKNFTVKTAKCYDFKEENEYIIFTDSGKLSNFDCSFLFQ